MIQIPNDIYENKLTHWCLTEQRRDDLSEEDRKALTFLGRISKAQMVERDRGEEYPFIESVKPTQEEFTLIEQNGWKESDNIQVKAYCLDLCSRQEKDKRGIKRMASDAYLDLYRKVRTPWYLVRSVVVRFFQKDRDREYLDGVTNLSPHIHGSWLKYVSEKLAKDCKDNLDGYLAALESMITALESKHNWHDAVAVLDALYAMKRMSREKYHLRRAQLYEEEFDYRVATQTETTYNMKLDSIKDAHQEISKIKEQYPDLYNRIRNKLIAEQKVFADKMHIFGVKTKDTIPPEFFEKLDELLKENPMTSPVELITTIRTIKFPTPGNVKKICRELVKASPMLYMSFGNSVAIGENGQTLGKADTEESLKIRAHKMLRRRIHLIVKSSLAEYLKRDVPFDEEQLGQALIDACRVGYIEESRKVLWAKGIVDGCKGDMIAASHILMPQIERALVVKAQQYCGDLTNYEREHHDQIGQERALTALKPYLKGVLYDELTFFMNHGADVNFRNRVAHGLMDPEIMIEEGIYLWWLAIKMLFCEQEFFKKK